jgi:hypothetical protein
MMMTDGEGFAVFILTAARLRPGFFVVKENNKMKSNPWAASERLLGRFFFLNEFEYNKMPKQTAYQLFDIENATLYVFICNGVHRKEDFLDDRVFAKMCTPFFQKRCELIVGKMGDAAPVLFGRNALMVFRILLFHSILGEPKRNYARPRSRGRVAKRPNPVIRMKGDHQR